MSNDRCFACGTHTNDLTFHELGCVRAFGTAISARHNLVRDELAQALRAIGGLVQVEPTPFPQSIQRTDLRWIIDGRDIHFDVSIINPLNKSVIKKAAKQQLKAAETREQSKRNKYDPLCQSIDAEFIPIVIESYGGYGKEFITFLTRLHSIVKDNLTLTDGIAIISNMQDQIARHVVQLNGLIMKWSSSQGD